MIRIECEQGGQEWLRAKVGIPSASNMHRILTPKTMKPSAAMEGYAYELIAERLLGRPLDDATTEFMQRGNLLEKSARDWYALQRDCDVERVGFITRDDGRVGCSPDGLIGAKRGLEIKCPSAAVHVGYMLGEAADKYRCQVQSSLWITEREAWDWVSFNPELSPVLIEFHRDEPFITALAAAVEQFLSMRDEMLLKLARLGHIAQPVVPALRIA